MALPIDAVCGMKIADQNAAPQSMYQGDAYYFCSADCKNQFDESPEKYAPPNPAVSKNPPPAGARARIR